MNLRAKAKASAKRRGRAQRMAKVRDRNARRGITMRPGWTYTDVDGSSHMSPTGRESDCRCGGKHDTPRKEASE